MLSEVIYPSRYSADACDSACRTDDIMRTLNQIERRARAVYHKGMAYALNGVVPYFIVNEFPKSGGTWLGQMLSDALNIPMPRNRRIGFERSIVHGHFLRSFGLKNVIVVWRDPRDVVVSYYFHCFFKNEHQNGLLVDMMRDRLIFHDYDDIRANLPRFLRYINETPLSPKFTWFEFAKIWAKSSSAVHTSYENLRVDTTSELSRVISAMGVPVPDIRWLKEVIERHGFDEAKARAEDQIEKMDGCRRSFVREGSVGGWTKHFSAEALDLIDQYYQPMMQKVGYE